MPSKKSILASFLLAFCIYLTDGHPDSHKCFFFLTAEVLKEYVRSHSESSIKVRSPKQYESVEVARCSQLHLVASIPYPFNLCFISPGNGRSKPSKSR